MAEGEIKFEDILEFPSLYEYDIRTVKKLLEKGIDPDVPIIDYLSSNMTPFAFAVKELVSAIYRKEEAKKIAFLDKVVNLMLFHGATGNGGDLPALYYPVKFGYTFITRKICRAGADPSAVVKTDYGSYSLIFLSRNLATAELLHQCGADPAARSPDGRNPMVALLDLRIRNRELWDRPIDLSSPYLIKWFIEMGNDPTDYELLYHAAYHGNWRAIDLLVEYGNDPHKLEPLTEGTLLHIAAESRTVNSSESFLRVVDVLIEKYELDVNSTDGSGRTPLDIALENGNFRTALRLLDRGARISRIPKNRQYIWTEVEEILVERGMYDSVIEESIKITENFTHRMMGHIRENIREIKEFSSRWNIPLRWKRALIVFPTLNPERKNPYMKLGGSSPAIDLDSWPIAPRRHFARSYRKIHGSIEGFKRWWKVQREKYREFPEGTLPMEHFMTIDLRILPEKPEGLSPDIVALSIFAPRREVPTIHKPAIKLWTEEDLKRPAMNPEAIPSYTRFPTIYLDYVEVEIPVEARLVIAREHRPYVDTYSQIEEALVLTEETKDELLPMIEAMKRMPIEVLNDFLCEMQFLMESLNMFHMIIGGISWVSPLVVDVDESFLPEARKLAKKLIPLRRVRRLLLELEPEYILPEPFSKHSPPLLLFTNDL